MRLITLYKTRFIVLCITIMLFSLVQNLCAQYVFKGVVKGKVVDDSTNTPLPLANVFIAKTTIGTVADIDGRYQIKEVPYGVQQVVASIVGYDPKIVPIHIVDTTENEIVFRLKLRNIQLSPVLIDGSEPKGWKNNLEKFIDEFFGSTPNAAKCKLLNPQVLDFTVNDKTSEFTATVREPLIIENRALGYRLYFYLKYYKMTNKVIRFFGTERYEQLPSENAEEIKRWKINQQNTYYGSKRHFFSTLFYKNSKRNGFKVKSIPKNQFLSDERNFYYGNGIRVNPDTFYGNGIRVDPDTLVSDGESLYEKKLSFPEILQVDFGNNVFNKKTSFIEFKQESITIYANGGIAEPFGILTYGDWSTPRVAGFLPSDYEP